MITIEITPFIPLTLRGRLKGSRGLGGLALWHLDFNCHLGFDISILVNGIATPRQVGARNDTLLLLLRGVFFLCRCEERSDEAISVEGQ